jgi:hypothetical protein
MDFDSFLGNLDKDELEEFYSLTPKEREEMKLELESEETKQKELADKEWRASEGKRNRLARTTTHSNVLDPVVDAYKSVVEGLPKSNMSTGKSLHPTARYLQNLKEDGPVGGAGREAVSPSFSEGNHPSRIKRPEVVEEIISRGPSNMGEYVSNAIDSGVLKDLGLTPGLQSATDKINYENRVIDKDEVIERQGVERQIELQKEEKAARIAAEIEERDKGKSPLPHIRRAQEVEAARMEEVRPSQLAPLPKSVLSEKNHPLLVSQDRERARKNAADAEQFEREYQEAAYPKESSWTDHLIAGKGDDLKKLNANLFPGISEAVEEKTDKEPTENEKKKEDEKIIKKVEKAVVSGKPPKDGVKFDKRGYPIYTKGSEWGNKFNKRFKDAVKNGETIFKWTGHDGKERSYTNDLATKTKTVEKTPKRSEEFISRYVKAPKKEASIILKDKVDKEPDVQVKKDIIAEAKESGPDKYWQDPITGFTFNLSKADRRRDRERIMKMGAMLPAEDRAPFFESKGLIDSEDLKAILKPTDKENFERRVKEMELRVKSSQLVLNDKKIKNYMTPEKKEYFSAYKNAIQHSSTQGIYTFGKLLGLNDSELTKIVNENTKLALSKVKGKEKDQFKARFGMSYDKIYNSREKIMMQTASVFDPGMYGQAMQIGGTTYKGRKGLMESFKLKELNEIKNPKNYFNELEKNHSMEVSRFFKIPRYLNKDGSRNYKKLLDSPMAYQEFLQNVLINAHMEKTTQGRYGDMERYRTRLQKKHEADNAELIKALTAKK